MRSDAPGGPIRWRMYIPVSPDRVFAALNTNEGRASFWAESAPEIAGFIHFKFINGMVYQSRILERTPPRVFAIEYFGGVARFELEGDENCGCDLTLVHSNVTLEEWSEVHAGWLNVLFPLKAAVTFQVDLRNHDPKRLWENGYADQ